MATCSMYPYWQAIAKANEKIDEVNQKIDEILRSDEYQAVSRHFPWGKPKQGTSEDDVALWCYF